jgi:hypothetical protein
MIHNSNEICMMIPRLQMKEPYRFRYNNIPQIDIQSYMNSYGFIAGLSAAWKDYVQEMMDHFDADPAANEGLEATIRALMPSRRRLTVSRQTPSMYMIECDEGGARALLSVGDDDSLIFSICGQDADDGGIEIDLGCHDSAEAASFIAYAFKAYRDLSSRFVKAFINS